MPTYIGKEARGKIIKVRPYESEGVTKLLWLSERQRGLMLALSEYLDWSTRWETLPSPLDDDDYRDAYVSQLKSRLMEEIEFCAEVIKCIKEDEDTQNELSRWLDSATGGTGLVPGEKEDRDNRTRNLVEGSNPGCNKDILWAQCLGVIDLTHGAIMDMIQKVLVSANASELIENSWNSIPLLAAIDDVLGIQGIVDWFQYIVEAIGEGYEGQYTETPGGMRDELAYALFCRCRIDCKITIARILDMLSKRVAIYTAPPSLEGFVNLLEQLFLINQDTSFIVDQLFFTVWGLVDTAAFLFGKRFDKSLELVIALKADEPSNDWETYEIEFGECPEEELLTPILKIVSDFYPAPKGYDLEPVTGEPGYWIVNSDLLPGGGYGIVLEEENGQPFSIDNRSFPDGLISANYNAVIDGVDTSLSFGSFAHHNMSEVYLAMFAGAANARFKFRFFSPA